MTQNERLRALLEQARERIGYCPCGDSACEPGSILVDWIDAALAEPAEAEYVFRGGYIEDAGGDRWWSAELLAKTERERDQLKSQMENTLDTRKEGAWMARALDAERERDEARAEVERLRNERDEAIDDCKLLVREVHALGAGASVKSLFNGRQRVAPAGSTPSPAPISDYRKSYSLLFRKAERQLLAVTAERDAAYRRGAEAMREAVVDLVVREVETWMKLGLSDDIRHLQIPEDAP